MRSLVRCDSGEGYEEYLNVYLESGIETPTPSSWPSRSLQRSIPTAPRKDGPHLAHKAEHA